MNLTPKTITILNAGQDNLALRAPWRFCRIISISPSTANVQAMIVDDDSVGQFFPVISSTPSWIRRNDELKDYRELHFMSDTDDTEVQFIWSLNDEYRVDPFAPASSGGGEDVNLVGINGIEPETLAPGYLGTGTATYNTATGDITYVKSWGPSDGYTGEVVSALGVFLGTFDVTTANPILCSGFSYLRIIQNSGTNAFTLVKDIHGHVMSLINEFGGNFREIGIPIGNGDNWYIPCAGAFAVQLGFVGSGNSGTYDVYGMSMPPPQLGESGSLVYSTDVNSLTTHVPRQATWGCLVDNGTSSGTVAVTLTANVSVLALYPSSGAGAAATLSAAGICAWFPVAGLGASGIEISITTTLGTAGMTLVWLTGPFSPPGA